MVNIFRVSHILQLISRAFFFFLSGFSFTTIHKPQGCRGRGRAFSLIPHYHFHPPHRHLDISRAITLDSSPLHIYYNWQKKHCKTQNWHTGILGLWTQELDAGLLTLDSGRWTLDAGLWTLDSGLWMLDSGR